MMLTCRFCHFQSWCTGTISRLLYQFSKALWVIATPQHIVCSVFHCDFLILTDIQLWKTTFQVTCNFTSTLNHKHFKINNQLILFSLQKGLCAVVTVMQREGLWHTWAGEWEVYPWCTGHLPYGIMRQLEVGLRSLSCYPTDALTDVHIDSQVILTDRDLRGRCEKGSHMSNEVVCPKSFN